MIKRFAGTSSLGLQNQHKDIVYLTSFCPIFIITIKLLNNIFLNNFLIYRIQTIINNVLYFLVNFIFRSSKDLSDDKVTESA